MAISTYAELLTALDNWTHRSDLTSRNPEFVVIGEARIGREVRARQMEQRVSSTPTTQYTNVPSDFLAMRAVRIQNSIGWLDYMTPDEFFNQTLSSNASFAKKYTIFGDELIFPATPDGDVELWYYKKLTALATATNTLFTDNPDLYLYAALAAAQPFLKDTKSNWDGLYQQARDQVNATHKQGRYPTGMRVRVA